MNPRQPARLTSFFFRGVETVLAGPRQMTCIDKDGFTLSALGQQAQSFWDLKKEVGINCCGGFNLLQSSGIVTGRSQKLPTI